MGYPSRCRLVALVAGFALAALIGASFGSAGRKEEKVIRATGPVIALYVIDHYGEFPTRADLVPYRQAFRRVLAGCWITPTALSSVIFQLSDHASLGSGTEIDNLKVLRGLAQEVGTTKQECSDEFVLAEAHLEGAALAER
jgi:hypothetical protein